MPRHQEPKKDVISCEKPRVDANSRKNVDIRMRELNQKKKSNYSYISKVVYEGERGELKHLSTHRKRKKTRFLKQWRAKQEEPKPEVVILLGLGLQYTICKFSRNVLEKHSIECESPVQERKVKVSGFQSSTRHEKSRMNKRGPSRKAKYYLVTYSDQYREGKVKRTPGGE